MQLGFRHEAHIEVHSLIIQPTFLGVDFSAHFAAHYAHVGAMEPASQKTNISLIIRCIHPSTPALPLPLCPSAPVPLYPFASLPFLPPLLPLPPLLLYPLLTPSPPPLFTLSSPCVLAPSLPQPVIFSSPFR